MAGDAKASKALARRADAKEGRAGASKDKKADNKVERPASSCPRRFVHACFFTLAWASVFVSILISTRLVEVPDWLTEVFTVSFLGQSTLETMGIARVLVLTLARASNRSEELVRQAEIMQIPLEFVEAADGFDQEFRSRVLPRWVPEATCSDFVDAIFRSHERAWATAAESSGPVLVLEDDARLPPLFSHAFAERMQGLPKNWDMAIVGTSISPKSKMHSRILSIPDKTASRGEPFRGLWAYVVSQRGALRLLRLAREARGCEDDDVERGRRVFMPVDRFVAQRLPRLRVLVFEPPADLASEFTLNRDTVNIAPTHRQVGTVRLANLSSLNYDGGEDHAEAAEMRRAQNRLAGPGVCPVGSASCAVDAGLPIGNRGPRGGDWATVIVESEAAFRRMRSYSCAGAATMLRSTGLAMLALSQDTERTREVAEAKRMLLLAVEALASSLRYYHGDTPQKVLRNDFQSQIDAALKRREEQGLPPVELPLKRELPGVGWLNVPSFALIEWLPNLNDSYPPTCLTKEVVDEQEPVDP